MKQEGWDRNLGGKSSGRRMGTTIVGERIEVGRGECYFFFFNDTATTEIYTLSLHDAFRSDRGVGKRMERVGLGTRLCSCEKQGH